MAKTYTEVVEEMVVKSKFLDDVLLEAGTDIDMDKVTSIRGTPDQKVSEFQRLHKELEELGHEKTRLENFKLTGQLNRQMREGLTQPGPTPPFIGTGSPGVKIWNSRMLRDALNDDKALKAFRAGAESAQINLADIDLKTLVTLTTISPQADRRDTTLLGQEERTVADLMLQGTTDRNTVDYYEETTFTNAAAETAEGSAYPEAVFAYTLRTENVRDIGHFIPVTRDAIDDNAFLESMLRGRMAFGVQRREEAQLLTGAGTGVLLLGLINRSGIQTQAKGADPTPDAVYKAMQLVRGSAGSGFAEPTAFIVHPSDWTDIRLLRTTAGDYLWGHPSVPGVDTIFGIPVRQTTAITAGTGLVGAFRPHVEMIRRAGLTVTLSTEHSTFFTERKVLLMAEERVALAVYRPSALATVTGI